MVDLHVVCHQFALIIIVLSSALIQARPRIEASPRLQAGGLTLS